MTPEEFNYLSQHLVPVLTDARPYGKYSMVDIADVGGVQVIVKELLDAGLLNGDVMTCTGETLAAQVQRLGGKRADGKVVHAVDKPYKPTGGLRVLGGNLSPDFSAILKLAGVEGGLEDNTFRGKARVFEGEQALLEEIHDARRVAGCAVTSGRLVRGKMRVRRRTNLIYEGVSLTLKRFQEEVNEVRSGMECGVRLDGFDDYQEGDFIECYTIEKVAQKL